MKQNVFFMGNEMRFDLSEDLDNLHNIMSYKLGLFICFIFLIIFSSLFMYNNPFVLTIAAVLDTALVTTGCYLIYKIRKISNNKHPLPI